MYVVNGNWTFAIDVATGRQIWRTPVSYERGALRMTAGGCAPQKLDPCGCGPQ
jgi:alcohol dehydrogenase (cytochrome c)